jgi:hypothetical protein
MADPEERREPESARMRAAINEVIYERNYQVERWGTDHDKKHSPQDWATILTVWIGKAASRTPPYAASDNEEFRKRLVQIAAICVAAMEALE